jgi:hypothetical protein
MSRRVLGSIPEYRSVCIGQFWSFFIAKLGIFPLILFIIIIIIIIIIIQTLRKKLNPLIPVI